MPEKDTRTTTLPADSSSSWSDSKPATTPSPALRMRNALNALMVRAPAAARYPSATTLAAPIVPRDQPLRVEFQIVSEQLLDLRVRQRAPVPARQTQPQLEHVGTDRAVAVLSPAMTPGDCHELADLRPQRFGQSRQVAYPAVVHEVHRLGSEAQHAVDGGDELLRIELCRGRRWC